MSCRSFVQKGTENSLALLAGGVALRILVFVFLAPLNNDADHLNVIKYIVEHHALPSATANLQSYHPPLYYLLAAPLYYITGSVKCVQVLSLVLSIATLLIVYRLLYGEHLIAGEKGRRYAFAFACFLPQLVQFGMYISNDTLAICLGALIVLQVVRYAAHPHGRQLAFLALSISLGLLTKATFLAFLPVLFVLVLFVRFRQGYSTANSLATALLVLVLSAGLGSYKFIRNYGEAEDPFYSNLDLPSFAAGHKRSYRGPTSFVDFNFLKLLRSPSLSPLTEGSYPLLLYGTFWYQHIPESTFVGTLHAPFFYLGSLVYALAVIPTGVFLGGLFILLKDLPHFLSSFDPSREEEQKLLARYAAVFFLFTNLGLLVVVTAKYHVWSIMQGRLLFPSFSGLLVSFGAGMRVLPRRKAAAILLKVAMMALVVCFGLYFSGEIAYQALLWLARHRAAGAS